MKYTKKIYRRGRNQGQSRKTAIRKREDKEDLAAAERALAEPGPNIPWEQVKKDLGLDELIKDKKAFAKEARRQSRVIRDSEENQELLEFWEKVADRTGWK